MSGREEKPEQLQVFVWFTEGEDEQTCHCTLCAVAKNVEEALKKVDAKLDSGIGCSFCLPTVEFGAPHIDRWKRFVRDIAPIIFDVDKAFFT